jgi:hypothetical protein
MGMEIGKIEIWEAGVGRLGNWEIRENERDNED